MLPKQRGGRVPRRQRQRRKRTCVSVSCLCGVGVILLFVYLHTQLRALVPTVASGARIREAPRTTATPTHPPTRTLDLATQGAALDRTPRPTATPATQAATARLTPVPPNAHFALPKAAMTPKPTPFWFDWKFYTKHYPDLAHLSEVMAYRHYKQLGSAEHRLPHDPEAAERPIWAIDDSPPNRGHGAVEFISPMYVSAARPSVCLRVRVRVRARVR